MKKVSIVLLILLFALPSISYAQPNDFEWDAPITVNSTTEGYTTDFDVSKYQVTGKTYYVAPNGNDANDGLSASKPLKSVRTALYKPDVDVILLADGVYSRKYVASSLKGYTRSVSIKAINSGKATMSAHEDVKQLRWSKNGDVYSANISTVRNAYDAKYVDKDGDYAELKAVNSTVEVNNTPGSFFYDGTSIHVRLSDSRAPDKDLRLYINIALFRIDYTQNATVYIEGVNFEGGRTFELRNTPGGSGSPSLYMKDVKIKYGRNIDGGLALKGAKEAFLQNVESAQNEDDGFNYHKYNDVISNVIELNCIGRDNGLESETDNGSSMHDGGSIIRINGEYYRNKGPNIADVGADTRSWNVGVKAYESKATVQRQSTDFFIEQSEKVEKSAIMWLEGCESYGSTTGLGVYGLGEAHIKNSKIN